MDNLKAALYIRVSTEEQRVHGLSLEAQKEALTKYAKEHDMYIVDYYVDEGLTARKGLSHRKALQRLLDDVATGAIDIIIFTKLDRWFRNIADYYKVQEILDKHKANWRTIFEDYDTATANGRLHINIMLSIAQDEADRTSERIRAVFESKRARGETPAWKAPLGYKIVNSKLLVNEDTKQIAIDIFDYYDLHHSIMGCLRMVNEKYEYKIYEDSIRRMFKNKTYIGEFRGYKNFCEAIIPEAQFYRIQSFRGVREFKNQLVAGRVYLFSSLIYCKECGHAMSSSYSRLNQKNGVKEFHYYRCKEYLVNRSCPHKPRANEEKIEKFLLAHIHEKLEQQAFEFHQIMKNQNKLKIDTRKIQKRLGMLKDLYLDELIDKDTYRNEYTLLTNQLDNANKINSFSISQKNIKLLDADFNSLYADFTQSEKKTFWLGIIERIVINQYNDIEFFLK